MQADSLDTVSRLCPWEPPGTDSPASLYLGNCCSPDATGPKTGLVQEKRRTSLSEVTLLWFI